MQRVTAPGGSSERGSGSDDPTLCGSIDFEFAFFVSLSASSRREPRTTRAGRKPRWRQPSARLRASRGPHSPLVHGITGASLVKYVTLSDAYSTVRQSTTELTLSAGKPVPRLSPSSPGSCSFELAMFTCSSQSGALISPSSSAMTKSSRDELLSLFPSFSLSRSL